MIRGALYRLHQFLRVLIISLTGKDGVDWGQIAEVLNPDQRALFEQMHPADRHHSWQVYLTLREREVRSVDLEHAALLHDVGKAVESPSLWVRVVVALLRRFAPQTLVTADGGKGGGWSRHLENYRQHAAVGAALAAKAGSSPLTVSLIRRHHDARLPDDELLGLLQDVDGSH